MRRAIIEWILLIFAILIFISGCGFVKFMTCKTQAKLYNEKYGTNYTTSDFYWAGTTIKRLLHSQKEETYNLNVNQ